MSLLKNRDDEIAFEYLYNHYINLMLYIANSILNNSADSEDAVQLAFMRIAKHFDSIEKTICPKTANQFVIIVRNIAIDIYRNTLYFVKRTGKKNWFIGQMLFVFFAIISFLTVILLGSVLMSQGSFTGNWSDVVAKYNAMFPDEGPADKKLDTKI